MTFHKYRETTSIKRVVMPGAFMQEDRVNSLVHAGGNIADALLPKQSLGGMRAVFAPKVMALHNAHFLS